MDTNFIGMEKFGRRSSVQKKRRAKKQTPPSTQASFQRKQICDIAARLVYEDGIRDYHKAKQRACEILGIRGNTCLPANEEVEQALHQRQRVFEPQAPSEKNEQLKVARNLLQILRNYQARLSGSLAEGMVIKGSPIEIHAFCNAIEMVSEELNWRRIPNWIVEKRYRYSNNTYTNVPLIICELDDSDIEISVFGEMELHRLPICPTNGRAYKRLALARLENIDTVPT